LRFYGNWLAGQLMPRVNEVPFVGKPYPPRNKSGLVGDNAGRNDKTLTTKPNHKKINIAGAVLFLAVFEQVNAGCVMPVPSSVFALNPKTVNDQVIRFSFRSAVDNLKSKVSEFFCAVSLKSSSALTRSYLHRNT
jgi:hypothetical protein